MVEVGNFVENPTIIVGCVIVIIALVTAIYKIMGWIDKKMLPALENSTAAMNNIATVVTKISAETTEANRLTSEVIGLMKRIIQDMDNARR